MSLFPSAISRSSNASELAALPMAPQLDRVDGELALTGPAGADGSANVSQDDIDALFA